MFTASGPVVVAGLGLALVERVLGNATPAAVALARRAHPIGAAFAVASVVLDPGGGAGLLAGVWLAVCTCATLGGVELAAVGWRGGRPTMLPALTLAAGLAFLSVGGAWLVVSRLGLRPLDLSTDIVRLTSVHFHFAGFGLAVLAGTGLIACDWLASRVALVVGCIAAVVAPPLVASGFALDWAVGQVGGALAMTVAAWTTAFGTFLLATSSTGPAAGGTGAARVVGRTLLVVASFAPLIPMVLAVQWALAQHTRLPALSIDDMAATHGVLNGVGFVMAGLAGWLLTGLTAPATGGETAIPAPG